MSIFSSWILSIAGIAILGVMMDLVLPDGQMQKYVKSMFSFLVIFVMISPLPKMLNASMSLEEFFGTEAAIEIQTQFIGVVNMQKKLALEKKLCETLETQGIKGAKANVGVDFMKADFCVERVVIDIGQVVITNQLSHIDMLALIKQTVKNIAGIKEEKIEINE